MYVLFSPGCWSMLLRNGCFLYVTVYMFVSPCCCYRVISLYVIAYVVSSKYLCSLFLSFLHDTFPRALSGVFSVLLIMRYFFRVAMYMWFSPYWSFEVLLSMCFLSSCCKIVVFSKLLFVDCVFYVVVKPHHLFLNVFLHF